MIELRYYQAEAVDAIYDHFRVSTTNPIVALPTAAGKSIVIAEFIRRALKDFPTTRIIKLAHRKELLVQNSEKVGTMWPSAPMGIYSAGLKRREIHSQILFASIQSIARANPAVVGHTDIIIIDECHLVPLDEGTQYREFINMMKNINPNVKVVGFTATPYRLDSGLLIESGVFETICYNRCSMDAFNQLVDDGFLCKLITKATATKLDVSGVHKRGGEFIPGELEQAVDKAEITSPAIREIVEYGKNRKAWLIFASGIEHAEHIYEELLCNGIKAGVLHSKIDTNRDEIIASFKSGKIQALVNIDILTTGFDHPGIDLIAMLRPTASPVLHVQTIGRGLRIDPSKENCLILDFAGNTARLGPINSVTVKSKHSKKSDDNTAPVKTCPECDSILHAAVRSCPDCGFIFPLKEKTIHDQASVEDIVAQGELRVTLAVDDVNYSIHRKAGKPDSLKVSYICGLRKVDEWVCVQHGGYAQHKAEHWWKSRTKTDMPAVTDDALKMVKSLRKPSHIVVSGSGNKYPRINKYLFKEQHDNH